MVYQYKSIVLKNNTEEFVSFLFDEQSEKYLAYTSSKPFLYGKDMSMEKIIAYFSIECDNYILVDIEVKVII